MLTTLPFKTIVDSRNAVLGTSNRFSISRLETFHVDTDVAVYVNPTSVNNTFCRSARISARNHYFCWFERLANVNTVFNCAALPSALTLQKSSHRHFRQRLTTHRGLATTSTVVHTMRTRRLSRCCAPMTANAHFQPIERPDGKPCAPSADESHDCGVGSIHDRLVGPTVCAWSSWPGSGHER